MCFPAHFGALKARVGRQLNVSSAGKTHVYGTASSLQEAEMNHSEIRVTPKVSNEESEADEEDA